MFIKTSRIPLLGALFRPRSAPAPDTEAPAPSRGSLLAVALVFVFGSGLTLVLYQHFVNLDRERVDERVLRGTQALAASAGLNSLVPVLRDVIMALQRIQQDLLVKPEIDGNILAGYDWTPAPPLQETVTVRYLPKVTYNRQTTAYEMLDLRGATLPYTVPIIDAEPSGLVPAVPRNGAYYPVALETDGGRIGATTLGVNHYNDWHFRLAMDQARDSGIVAARTSFPQRSDERLFVISHFYKALYTPGPQPTTLAERRARHTGFVSIVTFGLAADYIEFLPESYLGLEAAYFPETGTFAESRPDAALLDELGAGAFAHESFIDNGQANHIYSRASWSLRSDMQSPNRWWALSIGLVLTAWVCSLLLLTRRNATAMTALVESRTRALADRTRSLSAVNVALTHSEARYRMLADNVSDVIFTNDVDGICTYISPSIALQNGFTAEEHVGKPFYWRATPASIDFIKDGLARARANPDTFDFGRRFEVETICKDGTIKTIECSLTKIAGADGSYEGVLGVSRDVTERKKAEQQRLALEEAFRQSQKMEAIGTLAGGVAHDFNNLLTGILGHAELVKASQNLDRDGQGSLNVIETAALRAKELTSQLLGFARKGRLQTVDVRINDLVRETMALLDRTIDKRIRIQSALDPRALVVSADPGQISQVLLNLAVNARDAMPEGGSLTFETRRIEVDEYFSSTHYEALKPGPYCIISVTDTGTGIPRDKLGRIFEPFYTDKEDGKGTGLGLAMVYGVTRSHGGTVTVYSEVGIGTVFKVYLPLARIDADNAGSKNAQPPISGKGTILVVDDEAIVRNLTEAMLQKLGYKVLVASDGASAVEFYRNNWQHIDLVILDMIMPSMGGRECLEQMQKVNPGLKAIISTGYTHDTIANRMSDQKGYGFLQKPYRLRELSEVVASALR